MLILQPNGVEKILPIGSIDAAEKELLHAAVQELGPSIEKVRRSYMTLADYQGTSFQPAKL
jgi:malate/lactate dehydrogenase